MKKTNLTLEDFNGSKLELLHLKKINGGHVPPPGDPGDTNDPNNPNPPRPGNNSGYIDPNPDDPLNP
jgi:hypothetical protein